MYKLLEKERDYDEFGLGKAYENTGKRKRIRPWERATGLVEDNKPRKKKIV